MSRDELARRLDELDTEIWQELSARLRAHGFRVDPEHEPRARHPLEMQRREHHLPWQEPWMTRWQQDAARRGHIVRFGCGEVTGVY